MANTRPKVEGAANMLRLDPKINAAAVVEEEESAQRDHRSTASLIEVLILNHCLSVGLNPSRTSKERNQ